MILACLSRLGPQADQVVAKLSAFSRTRDLEVDFIDTMMHDKHTDALCPLSLDNLGLPVWEKHPNLPLEYGKKIEDGLIAWYSIGEYHERDLVLALATYLEVDLTSKFYEDLRIAKEITPRGSDPTVSTWHVATCNKSSQNPICEDRIYRYQVVDLLEDPDAGSVFLVVWTVLDPSEISGCPPPLQGFERKGCECTISRFTPMYDPDSGAYSGFYLSRANVSRPAPELFALAADISKEDLRDSSRIGNEQFFTKFRDHLSSPPDALESRMKSSSRNKLYTRVRERLNGLSPKAFNKGAKSRGLQAKPPSSMQRLGRICCCACGHS
jgi:hypothetical protein